ncbi:hypothetical protein BGZ96_004848 [Linnemannia gamsii]|uniref:Myb-like domain-containing protein n=1 Tax=Linnemannia gamsii TaxID=64522 RepID=A0ABQ7K525_9FUNG|nr:hypothetical protein BGZ96_004848 [Linnemannia gamsii]
MDNNNEINSNNNNNNNNNNSNNNNNNNNDSTDFPELIPADGTDMPAISTPSSSLRKSPFLGFTDNSQQDEHLVKALTINNPFKAGHGEKGATWERALKQLQAIDEVAAAHGQAAMFQGATATPCKSRWDALFAKHQKRIEAELDKTGSVPIETQHEQRIENLYNDQVEHDKTKSASKDANVKKRKRQQENRAMGAALRSSSLDMACYRSSSSVTEDEGSTSSASSASQPTKRSLSNPTTRTRIESDYKRRKRMAEDIAKMRTKLIEEDIQRHNEAEAKRQEQHHEIVNILKENSASQKQVFDTLNTLLQKLIEK